METSLELTILSGLTYYAEDSPVRTLALLDWGLGLVDQEVVSGSKCLGSFAYLDLDSCLWKMYQRSFFGESEELCLTWPRSGMTQNGIAFRLDTSARLTNEIASSYLPTPTKSMGKRGWGISRTGRNRYSPGVILRAFRFGYKPPVSLLEWMMGFPQGFTDIA